jgi:hypothetical protein
MWRKVTVTSGTGMRALSDDRRVRRSMARLLFPGPALLLINDLPFNVSVAA